MDKPESKTQFHQTKPDSTVPGELPAQLPPITFEGIDLEIPELLFFKDIKAFTLPFDTEPSSLAHWLASLNHGTQCYFSCQQLYRAIKALNTQPIEPSLRFALLDRIDATLAAIARHLEHAIVHAKIPPSATEQAYQELLPAVYAHLAHGFARIAQAFPAIPEENRSPALLAKALFSGLEALGKLLLHSAESYRGVTAGYWNACYRFYGCAEQAGLLDFEIGRDAGTDPANTPPTIAECFKSLLLFHLSSPNQCRPKEIKALSKSLAACAAHATLFKSVDAQKITRLFAFDLNSDAPPAPADRVDTDDKGIRYFDTLPVAKLAYDMLQQEKPAPTALSALKRPRLAQVVKTLSLGAQRRYVRTPVKKTYSGVIGYEKILASLRHAGSGRQNPAASQKSDIEDLKLSDLQLVPLAEEDKKKKQKGWQKIVDDRSEDELDLSIWVSTDDAQEDHLERFEIVDASGKGYGMILQETDTNVAIGEFIGIFTGDQHPGRCEIGIVRRINHMGRGTFSLGVELIASSAQAVCVYHADNVLTKHWAMWLRGCAAVSEPDGIIYPSHIFNVGDRIRLEQGRNAVPARIGKILHATFGVTYAELLAPLPIPMK